MNMIVPVTESLGRSRPRTSPRKAKELTLDTIIEGDCIDAMARLPDKSVDMPEGPAVAARRALQASTDLVD